jgi:hypothetical protein
MNKRIKISTIILAFGALFLSSCNLDETPNDALVTSTAWKTVSDAGNFRTGIYASFKNVNGGKYTYTSDYQTDILNATSGFGNRGGDIYTWNFTSSQTDIKDIYEYNYYCINQCDELLDNIDNIATTTDADKATLSNYKGEAYLMRAMCLHSLVLRFAKDYEPSTASTDLGLPLILTYDPSAKPARSTLQATYDQIQSDIASARKYLSTEGAANSHYLTKDVIDAFQARVDLYEHKYTDAVNLASEVIAKYPLDTNVTALTTMWTNDASNEILFSVFQSSSEQKNDYPNYLNYSTGTSSFQPDFVPTKWVVDLYGSNDIRKSVYFLKDKLTSQETTVSDVYMLNKYPGNPALQTASYQYYNMEKPFRAAEAYLIAAEASYKAGDAPSALIYLNNLKTARKADVVSGLSGDALFAEIKNEWIREFIGEGQRLNDLKRWHDGFIRHDTQDSSILLSGDGYTNLTINSSNKKFVWEFPANDLKANKNLISNW